MANVNKWNAPKFKQVQNKGTLIIDFNEGAFDYIHNSDSYYGNYNWRYILSLKLSITTPSGSVHAFESPRTVNANGVSYETTSITLNLDEEGEYCIRFALTWYEYKAISNIIEIEGTHSITATAYFAVAPEESLSPYTIKDVIDRVLSVTPTRTVNGTNKYRFKNNAEEYATEESPEFTFTGKHLFEVILDIASYKKMFPALYEDEIYFRPFWNGVMLTSDDLPPPDKAVLCSAIDQYCTALDSYVENMVCVNDTNVGTVVEPYAGGYISTRSNGGSEISETTAIIPTQSRIYQALELKVGETDGVEVGDIQSYVYEQEDYDSLSDTSAAYPYSKAYAIKFNRFEKNYTELSHRIATNSSIAAALTKPALANIIEKTTKGEVGNSGITLKEYLSAFIGKDVAAPFADLLFHPTYIPVVNARVRQYKPMYSHEDYESTLYYNQQSEVVDSEAFGEHVKGLIQKLGNHTEIRVYRFDRVDDIPTVGTLIDEKSVYNVAMTIFENHVDATICLVDYAELSTYIGVKNEIKTSDMSSTKWCNRFVNWEEFLVFTHEAYTGNTLSITKDALADIVSFTTAEPLTCAMFTSYAESGDSIMTAFAPIKHLALGNSIYFQWEMLDNFAVGYKSEKAPSGATSAWTGTKYDRAQRAVRYCDSFGRMEKLDFQLLKTGPTPNNSVWLVPESEIDWTVDENNDLIMFTLRNSYSCYVIVWFKGPLVGSDTCLIFAPGETTKSTSWGNAENETEFVGASLYDGYMSTDATEKAKILALRDHFMRKQIAHAYPEKSADLKFYPTKYEETKPRFQVYDLLVKKNSAESLKYAAQYHFRQTWREFVIGSGMSNFCSLVGGSCNQLQMFISALPINRFERHVKFDNTNYLLLDELPTFTVDEENLRVEIRLPSSVNSYIDIAKSWGLVGKDQYDNWQLIFGENRRGIENFNTTIYLVPRQKNNEPRSKATYMLSVEEGSTHKNGGYSVYANGIFYGQSGDFELPRRADITIQNDSPYALYIKVDGIEHYVKYKGSFSFCLTKNMTYAVRTGGQTGGDYSESV